MASLSQRINHINGTTGETNFCLVVRKLYHPSHQVSLYYLRSTNATVSCTDTPNVTASITIAISTPITITINSIEKIEFGLVLMRLSHHLRAKGMEPASCW